jgi:gliding motility-associated-like protein
VNYPSLGRFRTEGRVSKKMKRLIAFVVGCFFFVLSEAQNLVANPSFENYSVCPLYAGEIDYAISWFQPNNFMSVNIGSSDYYNQCAPYGNTSVPSNNYSGHQAAKTGSGYAGIMVYDGDFASQYQYREYIEGTLITPLTQGTEYCVEFYVSLADTTNIAISNIGVYFTNDTFLYQDPAFQVISLVPQIENSSANIIIDKENWILVSGSFIAAGGESFITIGNFRSDSLTNAQNVGGAVAGSYYYFDDFAVFRCTDTIPVVIEHPNNVFLPNAFSPNNDGNNDILFVRGQNITELNFKIYDRWGQRVFETNDMNVGWDGTYGGEKLENAVFVYFLTLTYIDGKTEMKKGNISLIR